MKNVTPVATRVPSCTPEWVVSAALSVQVMDRVIQKNQPVFLLVWLGSVVALLAAAALGVGQLDGTGRLLMIAAVPVHLLGVQLPTLTINVPMNNTVQALAIDSMVETGQESARREFESRWNT